MNINEQIKTVFSYTIECEYQDVKLILPIVRQLGDLTKAQDHLSFIELCENYVKEKPDYTLYELVLNEHPNERYVADLFSRHASRSLATRAIENLGQIEQERSLREIATSREPVADRVKKIKNIEVIKKNKPSTLHEIRDSRIEDREMERFAPSTGYPDLDNIIRGFIPGHVYTMTGDTNVGKTQIACNFAFRVASFGKRVLYFALEPDNTIIEYLASVWSGKKFRELTNEDLEPKVNIDVYTKKQVRTLEEMVRIVEDSERYDLVIIDHFGYFTTTSKTNKTAVESNAMKVIAQLAKTNKTAILSVVHLRKPTSRANKKGGKIIPSMNDISGSAAFKQDSTEVLLVMREVREDDIYELDFVSDGAILVAKTKSGKPGVVPITFVEGTALVLGVDEQVEGF